jgi:hypothetical protein
LRENDDEYGQEEEEQEEDDGDDGKKRIRSRGVIRRGGARGIRNMPLPLCRLLATQGMPWEHKFKHEPRGTVDVNLIKYPLPRPKSGLPGIFDYGTWVLRTTQVDLCTDIVG